MSSDLIGGIFTTNWEKNMEKIKQEAKKLWTLAIANKKITIGIVIVLIILYELATK